MDRRTLDIAVPVTVGLLVTASAEWFSAAYTPIVMLGGGVVALYFAALRQKLPQEIAAPQATRRIYPPVEDAIESADPTAPWGTPPAIEDRRDA
jgi:hypothetical protein